MSKINRNASSTIFGFEYQINVAIYFMFKYLQEISSIKVEGEEDVEIQLNDKSKYMVQTKSQTVDLYDDHNDLEKLKKSLLTLAEVDSRDVSKLYYVSNLINPLKTSTTEFDYTGVTIKSYNELSPESKDIIDKQIERNITENDNEKYNINRDKLFIMKLPFFGVDYDERHKYIVDEAKTVLSLMGDTLIPKSKSIIEFCESKFLDNGSDKKLKITKEEFCNWLILIEVSKFDLSNEHDSIGIEESDYYEAYEHYQKYIEEKTSSYESYAKVYSLYNRRKQLTGISFSEFVKQEKIKLYNYFFQQDLSDESQISDKNRLDVYIAQIISYAILKKKSIIDKINREANL